MGHLFHLRLTALERNGIELPYRARGIFYVRDARDLGALEEKFHGVMDLDDLIERYISVKETACGMPDCKARHNHGWVASMTCGAKVLVGRDCCRDRFNRKWSDVETRFNEKVNREEAEQILLRILREFPAVTALAKDLREGLGPVAKLKGDFQDAMTSSYYYMLEREVTANAGELKVYEQFQGRVGASARFSGDGKVFAVLDAAPFFAQRKFGSAVDAAMKDVEEAAQTARLGNFASFGTATLRDKHLRALRAVDKLVKLANAGEAAVVALSTESFETIVNWLSARNGGPTRVFMQDGCITNGVQRARPFRSTVDFVVLGRRSRELRTRLNRPTEAVTVAVERAA